MRLLGRSSVIDDVILLFVYGSPSQILFRSGDDHHAVVIPVMLYIYVNTLVIVSEIHIKTLVLSAHKVSQVLIGTHLQGLQFIIRY